MRARLAIKVSGVHVALREVALKTKPAALIAASSKGTVPVLHLPDGQVLEQSLDIMRWALAANDPQGWVRPDEASDLRALIDCNDGPFKEALDRYKYAPRHPARPAESYRDEAVELLLWPLERRLQQRRFLLRQTPSLADMAIVPFVRQFSMVEPGWFNASPLARVREWLNEIVDTPLFNSVMDRLLPWQPGDDVTVF